jgi:hypothetical protein
MARKLTEIDVAEISLVDAAANRKKFYIIKRGKTMKTIINLLKSVLGEEGLTAEEITKAEAAIMPEGTAEAVGGALAVVDQYKNTFPEAVEAAVQTLIKSAVLGYQPEGEASIEKVGARLSKATLEEVKKIRECIDSTLGGVKALKQAKAIADGLIGDGVPDDKEKSDKYAGLPPEVRARLEKLDDIEAQAAEDLKKAADKRVTDLEEAVKAQKAEIEALKKTKGISKAAKGQGDADDEGVAKKDEPYPWTSLTSHDKAEE